ncbi:hypothetical protein C1E_0225550 [Pseudomonas amygdali pv. tabaci str. ATCC 11528]|nr:hypothetical protein C1E_0225550 [Pseudomonas amygdali pv. tabaci str. ATCC 11528]
MQDAQVRFWYVVSQVYENDFFKHLKASSDWEGSSGRGYYRPKAVIKSRPDQKRVRSQTFLA